MSKLLPLESVPGLSRASADDPLFRGWLERIARNVEQQSRLLRRAPTGTAYPQAEVSGLVVNVVSATSITVQADEIWVKDAESNPEILTVNNTVVFFNTTVALANVLDTGAVAINTWYYLYAIFDGTNSRILASTSATTPTMPVGYTHKGLLTAVRTNGAGALPNSFTQGRRTEITRTTVLSQGTSAAVASVSVAAAAPPIGRWVSGWAIVDATVAGGRDVIIALDGVRGEQRVNNDAAATTQVAGNYRVAYAGSAITYQNLAANNRTTIQVTGWEF